MTIPQALEMGMEHCQAGRLLEAEAVCRRILVAQPDHADALHVLGVIACQVGRAQIAVGLIRRAIALHPAAGHYYVNLGNALKEGGEIEEAIAAYRQALRLKPDLLEAHNNLGNVLKEHGQLDEAIAAYRKALECNPDLAEAHMNLGKALREKGQLEDAIAAFRRALECKPDLVEAHIDLANALQDRGLLDEAIAAYRRALQLAPDSAIAANNLGNALMRADRSDGAIAAYRLAVRFDPHEADTHNGLGNALLGRSLHEEALECYGRALLLRPSNAIHSSILAALHYCPGITPAALLEAHLEYDRRHAAPLRAAWRPHPHMRDPERRLRLGFISPHFAFHAVGYFLVPLLEHLDPGAYEIICYSDMPSPDAMTARIRTAATKWHEVSALKEEQLAEQIRTERIDILFDLAGHTPGNRLPVFARKPAPIQITWLDYVGTTGLAAMDYLLADPREMPPDPEPWCSETVLRMPDDYICYNPPRDAPPVAPLAALDAGYVTFGSFNIAPKITQEIIGLWARILSEVPRSRLILKNRGFDDAGIGCHYRRLFRDHGISEDRLELLGWSPSRDVLACYHRVDVALDTYPYNGGLTTCEALWMGVPVVTCPGETFASRHGLTHLSTVGCTETIAGSLEEYVTVAVALASDLPRLAAMRKGLRPRVAASPLCDGRRFAAHFATLLRGVWRQWTGDTP